MHRLLIHGHCGLTSHVVLGVAPMADMRVASVSLGTTGLASPVMTTMAGFRSGWKRERGEGNRNER